LADRHGFEPVFQQDRAGVNQGNFARHNCAPSVVIDNLNVTGVTAVQPDKAHTPLAVNAYAVLAPALAFQGLYTKPIYKFGASNLSKSFSATPWRCAKSCT
jgi:hypothetical protein